VHPFKRGPENEEVAHCGGGTQKKGEGLFLFQKGSLRKKGNQKLRNAENSQSQGLAC